MFERYAYRYSEWDETQQVEPYTADDIADALADDLMESGNIEEALNALYRRGGLGDKVTGLRTMIERLRGRRQRELRRHDLGSIIEDIRKQLDEIISMERSGIDKQVADKSAAHSPLDGDTMLAADSENLRSMFQSMADKKRAQLDALPDEPAGQLTALGEYEFMDADAREKFRELQQVIQKQVMQSYVQGMQESLKNMTPEDIARTRDMVRDLNDMLEDRIQGREPKFQQFMDKYGELFPGVQTLDELLEQMAMRMGAMNSLMQSMSPEMRDQLQSMMDAAIGDDRLRVDMMRLANNLSQLMPEQMTGQDYALTGDQPVTMLEAMAMMERLRDMDALEDQMSAAAAGEDVAGIDADKMRDVMGPEAAAQLERLQNLAKMLEDAGYVRREGDKLELTPHALRKMGQKALRDVFSKLDRDGFGRHATSRHGAGGERIDETKPYVFGDPFFIDIKGTMMNALERNGVGTPVRMAPEDFEVSRTELLTQASTVLMLDKSRSMFLNDCWLSAKKVALALDSLIRGQYPRDTFHIVEFSFLAQEIKPRDLPGETWDEYSQGTNFQHGLMIARNLLARSKSRNKQIIIITDGEPTAHLEDGIPEFDWPTSTRCLRETLREVGRVTKDGITINTFMLETSDMLTSFVDYMTKINKGRAFYASPEQLGEYVLVDYLRGQRGRV